MLTVIVLGSCRDMGPPGGLSEGRPLADYYECPPQYPNCQELTQAERDAIYDALNEIGFVCACIIDEVTALLESGRITSQSYLDGYTGYYGWSSDESDGAMVIQSDQFSNSYDLISNLLHESRHAMGDHHDPQEGYYDDEDEVYQDCVESPLLRRAVLRVAMIAARRRNPCEQNLMQIRKTALLASPRANSSWRCG